MTKTRIAVIGLGMAVAPHAKSLTDLADRVEVAACYSPTEARRRAFADTYGLPVGDDLDAILADRTIDAVMILTPPNTHLDLVRRAAEAGKHVLLEKPLEISFQRSAELVETAERAGIKLGVVLQHRFRPVGDAQFGHFLAAAADQRAHQVDRTVAEDQRPLPGERPEPVQQGQCRVGGWRDGHGGAGREDLVQ